ncbi:MAG: aldehyde ferredoxin oxidoreductase family protein [Planctomycetes bacterium]|nr:aldehyde ferredoxin oxidoreductase family protein [Planctomycetota bacterium]
MPPIRHAVVLEVNLGTGRTAPREVPEEMLRRYLGGSGLAARMLYDELDPAVDPLAPESPLVVMNGLLTGSPVICCNKVCLCARSPLTGIWGESRAGGFFGAELARTGIMGIVFRGQAPQPVYLWVHDGQAELRPAGHVWGKDTFETAEMLRGETDAKAQVGAIGPAGERLVRFASVMFGGREARAAGRTGMGAVMGAKRLKAVVVRGKGRACEDATRTDTDKHGQMPVTQESPRPCVSVSVRVTPSQQHCLQVARPDELRAAMRAENPKARDDAGRLREFGTAGGLIVVEAAGDLPIKNWQLGSWTDQAKRIAPQTHFARTFKGHYACFGCPIRCGKTVRVPAHEDAGHGGPAHNAEIEGHAPEYETAAGFGPLLLNEDLDTVFAANELCNRYGLDTISTAAAVAFAFEAAERGLDLGGRLCPSPSGRGEGEGAFNGAGTQLGAKTPSPQPSPQGRGRTGGESLGLRWGDGQATLALIHQIARREGIGKLLGEGVRRAAEALGGEAASFAMHTKGLEYPFHDPRAFISMAPDYATGSRGSCHLESFSYILGYGSPMPDFGIERGGVEPHDHGGAARIAVLMQNLMAAFDALGMCKFVARNGTGPSKLAHWLSLATGWEVSAEELMAAGERLFNLKRAYNLRCGVRGGDDRLPGRFLHLDRKTGGAAGSLPDMARLLPEYYALRGWDARGFPTPDTLRRLGLDEVAADLMALKAKIEDEDDDEDEDD